MFLFDIFRSFVPIRNPLGFGLADFIEFTPALALLSFALVPYARRLARRPYACFALLTLLPIALRLALLPHQPLPVPAGADDFSYLLSAGTLAHFRLANPVHPMHRFFEAVFILQEPSYASIYPPGQGLVLAFGQLIFGHPWAGVVLSTAALCGFSYWMLRAWTTPGWAFAGGLLAVYQFGPLSEWMNLYWGGAVSAVAGCLIFGALPRRSSWLLGTGIALQSLTRPFELVLLLPMLLLWDRRAFRGRSLVPILLPILPAAALILLQNHAVTRHWTTLPYQLSRYEYGVPATFTFQPNPAPHRPLTAEQQLDYKAQSAIHGDSPENPAAYLARLAARLRYLRFFVLPPLYLALPFFVFRINEPRYRWAAAVLLVLFLGTNFYPYFYPHYIGVATCLFLLVAIASLERIGRSARGLRASQMLLALCTAHFLFWYAASASGQTGFPADPNGRATIGRQLDALLEPQLVFVRYAPRHMFHEWIHNSADIDASHVVWAADRGDDEDALLRRYYPHRTSWLLEPDAQPPRLTPFPTRPLQ